MHSQPQAQDALELSHYLRFLRSSGFSDAAAKLELEFNQAPESETRGLSPQAAQPEHAVALKEQQRYAIRSMLPAYILLHAMCGQCRSC